jgi:actin-related protein 6
MPPKPSKQPRPSTPIPSRTLVVDNGAYTIKAGFSTPNPDPQTDCHIIPNCLARSRDKKIYIGAQIAECKDFGEMTFRRPVEKGYVVNWEAEKEVWESWMGEKDSTLQVRGSDGGFLQIISNYFGGLAD